MIDPPVRTVHVDLDQPLRPLPPVTGAGGLHVVFWAAGVPLGEHYLHPTELPLSQPQVATLAANVTALAVRARLAVDASDPPVRQPLTELRRSQRQRSEAASWAARAAVVVVTRDRPAALERCLTALARLDPAPAETVIVDNSRSGSARPVVQARLGIGYVHAPRGGLAAARNVALERISHDIVAFTDDDVEVHAGWLGPLLAPFARPQVASVTGLVLPAVLETEAQLAFERTLGYLNKGFRPRRYDRSFLSASVSRAAAVWDIGAGANLALRRSAVQKVGGFDPRLGSGASGVAEDSELWYRLLEAGWECSYEPAAVVFHHHRADVDELAAQTRAYLRGHVAGLAVQYVRYRRRADLRRALVVLPRRLAFEATTELAGGRVRRRLLIARVRGYLEGLSLMTAILRTGQVRGTTVESSTARR